MWFHVLSGCVYFSVLFFFISSFFFFFNDTATTEIYTLSLHDALPISSPIARGSARSTRGSRSRRRQPATCSTPRSEEHTSELQSPCNLVCRLLLEKKKNTRREPLPCDHCTKL